jgi:hypothetical protein
MADVIENDCAAETQATAGDLTVCLYCATVLIFNHDQSLRCASSEDIDELDVGTKRELAKLRAVVEKMAAPR